VSAGDLLNKAERALLAAERALDQSDSETAADRAYYAVFYAAWGLLEAANRPRPKTHNGLIADLSQTFVRSGRLDPGTAAVLSRLQNLRLVADYTLEAVPIEDAGRALVEAKGFIESVRALLPRL
jgi:uncharacterized protein (UPF0332 family)